MVLFFLFLSFFPLSVFLSHTPAPRRHAVLLLIMLYYAKQPTSKRATPTPLFSWSSSFILYSPISNPPLPFHLSPLLRPNVLPHHSVACFSAHQVLLTQGVSQPVHLLLPHLNSPPSSQFRFFWPSEAQGCVFLRQTINSSPKKINALERKLGAFLTK